MVNFKKTGYLWRLKLLMMVTIVGFGMNYTSQRSFAQDDQRPPKFFCGTYQGSPATMVRTLRGDVPLISWLLDDWGYTPLERCKEVSQRFQRASDRGVLKYLTTGTVNGYPVICGTDTVDGSCRIVLITLPPGTDATSVLMRLLNVRSLTSPRGACLSRNQQGLCSGWLFSD